MEMVIFPAAVKYVQIMSEITKDFIYLSSLEVLLAFLGRAKP